MHDWKLDWTVQFGYILAYLTCKSTILFPKTFPFIMCAPVLIAFNDHLMDISEKVGTIWGSNEGSMTGDSIEETTAIGRGRANACLKEDGC